MNSNTSCSQRSVWVREGRTSFPSACYMHRQLKIVLYIAIFSLLQVAVIDEFHLTENYMDACGGGYRIFYTNGRFLRSPEKGVDASNSYLTEEKRAR